MFLDFDAQAFIIPERYFYGYLFMGNCDSTQLGAVLLLFEIFLIF